MFSAKSYRDYTVDVSIGGSKGLISVSGSNTSQLSNIIGTVGSVLVAGLNTYSSVKESEAKVISSNNTVEVARIEASVKIASIKVSSPILKQNVRRLA